MPGQFCSHRCGNSIGASRLFHPSAPTKASHEAGCITLCHQRLNNLKFWSFPNITLGISIDFPSHIGGHPCLGSSSAILNHAFFKFRLRWLRLELDYHGIKSFERLFAIYNSSTVASHGSLVDWQAVGVVLLFFF